jgi:hypothetical protein
VPSVFSLGYVLSKKMVEDGNPLLMEKVRSMMAMNERHDVRFFIAGILSFLAEHGHASFAMDVMSWVSDDMRAEALNGFLALEQTNEASYRASVEMACVLNARYGGKLVEPVRLTMHACEFAAKNSWSKDAFSSFIRQSIVPLYQNRDDLEGIAYRFYVRQVKHVEHYVAQALRLLRKPFGKAFKTEFLVILEKNAAVAAIMRAKGIRRLIRRAFGRQKEPFKMIWAIHSFDAHVNERVLSKKPWRLLSRYGHLAIASCANHWFLIKLEEQGASVVYLSEHHDDPDMEIIRFAI